MSLLWSPPNRDIALTRSNSRNYFFSFENMNGPAVPNLGRVVAQRPLFDFPVGTTFKFRAKDEYTDIIKVGTLIPERKEIMIPFKAEDTASIVRDKNIYYEMDAFFPDGNRYTILRGNVVVTATRNLNG